jgi:hypothetical protein
MRRKTYGSPMRTNTSADVILNRTLRDKVTKLESEKREFKQKYNKTKLELEQTKTEKSVSDFKLKKAKSEADLREQFDRFTSYSKPNTDLNLTKTSSSGLGSTRYSWSDTNYDGAYKVGSNTQGTGLTNGSTTAHPNYDTYSSRRDDHVTRTAAPYDTSYQQRRLRGSLDDSDVTSEPSEQDFDHRSTHAYDRHRTLSSGSSTSSLLEYEYGANIRIPHQPSTYSTRDTKVELREPGSGRRTNRPHSYHAGKNKL